MIKTFVALFFVDGKIAKSTFETLDELQEFQSHLPPNTLMRMYEINRPEVTHI